MELAILVTGKTGVEKAAGLALAALRSGRSAGVAFSDEGVRALFPHDGGHPAFIVELVSAGAKVYAEEGSIRGKGELPAGVDVIGSFALSELLRDAERALVL